MSQYLNIFVKSKDSGAFTRIYVGTFWHYVHDSFGYVPYEKVRLVTESELTDNIHNLDQPIEALKKEIASHEALIKEIGQWNNSIEEKMQAIDDERDAISDIEEDMLDPQMARQFLWALRCMDIDGGLYVGLECGDSITDADIENKT